MAGTAAGTAAADGAVEVRGFRRGAGRQVMGELLAGCAGAVAQGQLANDVLLELPGLPVAIDLYDPWLVENLSYRDVLGLDPYRNDHATWVLQMSRGDLFLCSSQDQRLFYLGFLAALGRVNPQRVAADPDLDGLIVPVPFGVPARAAAPPPLAAAARGRRDAPAACSSAASTTGTTRGRCSTPCRCCPPPSTGAST